MLKLSHAKIGKKYKVEKLTLLDSLSKRLAILGVNVGVCIELLALYKHGAMLKTSSGKIALGADLLDAIVVTVV
ncbi:MAG TPA: ferrous iron transport protein A [Oceanospirillales bacterium]|nr:ferrous iron transport protein A [Oceanospirillales bacterium]